MMHSAVINEDNKNSFDLLQTDPVITVLAVEDDQIAMAFLEAQIGALGHSIIRATNGREALDILENKDSHVDVVLMDRLMPEMDGIETLKHMQNNLKLRHIPVIMVSAADSTHEIKEGLDAGVFYYLTKPVSEDMLSSVLSAAIREVKQANILAEELGCHRNCFNLMQTVKFHFSTLHEARSLAAFMANCFPEPQRVLTGLGELLINAIEHGNLGVGYDRKTELIEKGIWENEIQRLQKQPKHHGKIAEATIAHKDGGVYVVIQDQGDGFEWKKYMRIDPARAGHSHGRGIAQARSMSFDKLTYNPKGNQVVAFVNSDKRLQW